MAAVAVAGRRDRRWEEFGRPAGVVLLAPLLLLLTAAFVVPLVWLFWVSISTPHLGLQTYRELLAGGAVKRALVNTAVISAVVTGATVLVGGFLAWELRAARSRAYRLLLWALMLLPLWTSVVVRNYAFTALLARRGVVNTLLQEIGVVHAPLGLLYTRFAVALAMLHSLIPYAALPLYGVFALIDLDLHRAARSLGATAPRAFASVIVPLVLPSVVAVSALVFITATGFYVAPVLLGSPQSGFIATILDQQVNDLYDVPGAAAAAFLLLAGSALALLGAVLFVGRRRLLAVLR